MAGGDGVLPMFPLGAVLLPGEEIPLQVFEPRYLDMIEHCVASPDRLRFGVVLIARGHEVGGGDERTGVGTVARITSCRPVSGGRLHVGCVGEHRIAVDEWLPDDPYPRARVRVWPDEPAEVEPADLDALTDQITALTDLAEGLTRDRGVARLHIPDWDDVAGEPGDRAFALARELPLGPLDRLRVLSAPDAAHRVRALTEGLADAVAGLRFRLGRSD